MQRNAWVLVALIATVGCQRGETPTAKNADGKANSEVANAVASGVDDEDAVKQADFRSEELVSKEDSPGGLVQKFVSALKAGDARTVSELLTDKARYETRRYGLEVKPQLLPDTAFEVGETEIASKIDGLAYVKCRWLEPEGEMQAFELVWIVKHEEEGWRISGFFTDALEAGQKRTLLNFEDVQSMLATVEPPQESTAAHPSDASSRGR